MRPNRGKLTEGVCGTFGKLSVFNTFNTTTYQELLDCTHSKAHYFKQEWE